MGTKRQYEPPLVLTPEIMALTEEVSQAVARMNQQWDPEAQCRAISGTLYIDGITLSCQDIETLRSKRIPSADSKDIRIGVGALRAFERLSSWDPTSQADLLDAHSVFMEGTSSTAGFFRNSGLRVVRGGRTMLIAPPPERAVELLEELLAWLSRTQLHPLQRALAFHSEFEFIHPFADGNGFIGRLWQRAILRRWQPATVNIPLERTTSERIGEYFQALKLSNRAIDSAPYVEFGLRCLARELRRAGIIQEQEATPQINPFGPELNEGGAAVHEAGGKAGNAHTDDTRYITIPVQRGTVGEDVAAAASEGESPAGNAGFRTDRNRTQDINEPRTDRDRVRTAAESFVGQSKADEPSIYMDVPAAQVNLGDVMAGYLPSPSERLEAEEGGALSEDLPASPSIYVPLPKQRTRQSKSKGTEARTPAEPTRGDAAATAANRDMAAAQPAAAAETSAAQKPLITEKPTGFVEAQEALTAEKLDVTADSQPVAAETSAEQEALTAEKPTDFDEAAVSGAEQKPLTAEKPTGFGKAQEALITEKPTGFDAEQEPLITEKSTGFVEASGFGVEARPIAELTSPATEIDSTATAAEVAATAEDFDMTAASQPAAVEASAEQEALIAEKPAGFVAVANFDEATGSGAEQESLTAEKPAGFDAAQEALITEKSTGFVEAASFGVEARPVAGLTSPATEIDSTATAAEVAATAEDFDMTAASQPAAVEASAEQKPLIAEKPAGFGKAAGSGAEQEALTAEKPAGFVEVANFDEAAVSGAEQKPLTVEKPAGFVEAAGSGAEQEALIAEKPAGFGKAVGSGAEQEALTAEKPAGFVEAQEALITEKPAGFDAEARPAEDLTQEGLKVRPWQVQKPPQLTGEQERVTETPDERSPQAATVADVSHEGHEGPASELAGAPVADGGDAARRRGSKSGPAHGPITNAIDLFAPFAPSKGPSQTDEVTAFHMKHDDSEFTIIPLFDRSGDDGDELLAELRRVEADAFPHPLAFGLPECEVPESAEYALSLQESLSMVPPNWREKLPQEQDETEVFEDDEEPPLLPKPTASDWERPSAWEEVAANWAPPATPRVRPVYPARPTAGPFEQGPHSGRLLSAFRGEMSGQELQEALGLRDRKSFRERYIGPAIKEGLIEMTIPDKPNSRLQKYRLTDRGKHLVDD